MNYILRVRLHPISEKGLGQHEAGVEALDRYGMAVDALILERELWSIHASRTEQDLRLALKAASDLRDGLSLPDGCGCLVSVVAPDVDDRDLVGEVGQMRMGMMRQAAQQQQMLAASQN